MFLFGLGFLLLETRSVTEMNLAWGGTWLTSAVVFGSILAVVLGSHAARRAPTPRLRLGHGRPHGSRCSPRMPCPPGPWPPPAFPRKLRLSVLFVGAPIFFAASCFAILFRGRETSSTAFGWNLLGAVAGGLLEFGSMAVGLKALLLAGPPGVSRGPADPGSSAGPFLSRLPPRLRVSS